MRQPYQKTIEPYASRWKSVLNHAKGRGLIHGMTAHDLLAPRGVSWGPADTAGFLRVMVEAGDLRPVAKDLAGAGHSVRAFRGLQGLHETTPPRYPDVAFWLTSEATDAHVWTFEAVAG